MQWLLISFASCSNDLHSFLYCALLHLISIAFRPRWLITSLKNLMHNPFLFFCVVWFSRCFLFIVAGQGKFKTFKVCIFFQSTHLYMALCHVTFICKGCYKPVAITASLLALFVNHHREQERYLLRIQELETTVARLGEESIDRATLLESVQSDKETISRSVWPNWKLQIIVSWLEQSAFKLWLMKVVCR